MEHLTSIYGIKYRFTTAYHPSTNGLVECCNKEVSRALKKFCEGTFAAWNNWIPLVQLKFNKIISVQIESAEFSLMFGGSFNGFENFSTVPVSINLSSATDKIVQVWRNFRATILSEIAAHNLSAKKSQE
jgi:hypothetical protein